MELTPPWEEVVVNRTDAQTSAWERINTGCGVLENTVHHSGRCVWVAADWTKERCEIMNQLCFYLKMCFVERGKAPIFWTILVFLLQKMSLYFLLRESGDNVKQDSSVADNQPSNFPCNSSYSRG